MSNPECARELVQELIRRNLTVATAESLTGGAVAASLVSVAGVSAVFQGGIVAYQNQVKADLLGVSTALLERVGSVDGEVAAQMAQGAAHRLGSRLGLATTGAAGPESHDGQPVGTVFLAVALDSQTRVVERHYSGDRDDIRRQSVTDVLALAHEVVAGCKDDSQ
ncbi:CinA family protein [Psychromicrobium xiongbiense]|uniref:CinA family protein n=1 Tax=Psychromicrobium xiongbiense TaxID=3051184 RepID=UPI002557A1DB|nr:CinA family protein [Psychromicrobium sp. YIM S02556]